MYHHRFGLNITIMTQHIWSSFLNVKTKKFQVEKDESSIDPFSKLVIEPIKKIVDVRISVNFL